MQTTVGFLQQPTPCRTLLVGLGSAGCHALSMLEERDEAIPDSLAVHTNAQSLEYTNASIMIQLGITVTNGLGTGGDANLGKSCAEEERQRFEELFANYDLVVLITGLGGGTGNGAAPVILEAAKTAKALTLCLAVLPFDFEGEIARIKAQTGLAQISESTDGIICFPNQRLFGATGEEHGFEANLKVADQFLCECVLRIWRLLTRPGLLHLDFADIRELVKHSSGTSSLASTLAEGEGRIHKAIHALRTDPLLEGGSVLEKARAMMVAIEGGPDLELTEIDRITKDLTSICPYDATLFTGVAISEDMAGKISVTVMASETWVESKRRIELLIPMGAPPATQTELQLKDNKANEENSEPVSVPSPTGEVTVDLEIPTYIRNNISLVKT